MVTLVPFSGRNVRFINFDRANVIEERRVKCSVEALDGPMDCLVCHVYFPLQLSEIRIKLEKA